MTHGNGKVGIIPAAGLASRIGGIPKFLLPCGDDGEFLLRRLQRQMFDAGIGDHIVPTRTDSRDVVRRGLMGRHRLMVVETATMAETVLKCRDEAGNRDCYFGMPDGYIANHDVFSHLALDMADWRQSEALAILALVRTRYDQRGKLGMVSAGYNESRQIMQVFDVVDKDAECGLSWAWVAMAWRPAFWRYIKPEMPHVGYAVKAAIDDGQTITARLFNSQYWDCGTFDEYGRLVEYIRRSEMVVSDGA